ncbi:unnamed protein product, partial [Polarella glacialis]
FSLQGWGLSNNDKLRLIPAQSTCSDNSNNPASDTAFKVGCPAQDGQGCSQATPTNIISATVATSINRALFITAIDVGQTQTQLTFSAKYTGILEVDDVITLDFDRIRVNGVSTMEKDVNDVLQMSPVARLQAYKISGEYEFQDNTGGKYLVGHRLGPVYTSSKALDDMKLTIPVGWISGENDFSWVGTPFTFTDDQGWFTRRNKLDTAVEIKGTQAVSNMKLCWGVYDAGGTVNTMFYHEAGQVSFYDPPPMASAAISLTTKQKEAVAPVVVSFKTLPTRSSYASATGETMLVIRFLDVSGKLEPMYFAQQSGERGVYEIPANEEVITANKRQNVCGRLFLELWSSDSEGFPMPLGCYYSKKLADLPPQGQSAQFFREITIVFGANNGLRQDREYQMVMNMNVKEIDVLENVVDLYAMCGAGGGCSRPYEVFEKGRAIASMATEQAASVSDPNLANNGFLIQRGSTTDAILNLSELNILQIRLTGGNGLAGIVAESFLRLYLWPLTSWNIGSAACSAECKPFHFNTKRCAGKVGCTPEEAVASSGKRNIVKIKLPTDMDTIDGETTHTIKITGLTLPSDGFFPTKIGVQLTRPDDSAPFYTQSTGYLMKFPEAGRSTGRLVVAGRSGSGPYPFKGDAENTLYLRLRLGATIWNVGRNNAAFVEINLPPGYGTCKVAGSGEAPQDLNIFGLKTAGYTNNNRGILAVSNDDGDWNNSAIRLCTYELSANNQAIYAGMVFYVGIQAANPGEAMPKLEDQNVWTIKLSSLGSFDPVGVENPAPKDMPLVPFISLAEEKTLGQEYWGGNAAIISKLNQELVQPGEFIRSCCGLTYSTRKTEEYLRIFFLTTVFVGQNGFIVFDAPEGFDFGASCSTQDLPERYYAFVGGSEFRTLKLKSMGACVGTRFPHTGPTYNRARLQVGGIIDAGSYYGFEIKVTHPTTYLTSQHTSWYLWTQDSNGYGLEGSDQTIKFNKFVGSSQQEFYHKSWGMYDGEPQNIGVQIINNRPMSTTGQATKAIVYPIMFPADTDTSLRITAPSGFRWAEDITATFGRRTNGTMDDFPVGTSGPVVQNGNQLVWKFLSVKGGQKMGFQAGISVPDFNPVVSSNSFFIEFGFNDESITKRLFSTVVEAQPVAALTNAAVDFATNLVNYQDNRISFAVQTVTELPANAGIVIKGSDTTTGFKLACPVMLLPDSDPLPSDVKCLFQIASDRAPQITLKAIKSPIPPGYYSFEMAAVNPETMSPAGEVGAWTFGTFMKVSEYPTAPSVDKELTAVGFRIDEILPDSRLLDVNQATRLATNRNDRPGKPNQLIFRFQMRKRPESDRTLSLKGPRGFEFYESCLEGLITEPNDVFGPNTLETWNPDYELWPKEYRPTKCSGKGREARIDIPTGLARRSMYVFRIAVQNNPMETPQFNKWSINFNDEASDPFDGFRIWTSTGMTVNPASTAKSAVGAGQVPTVIPVTFTFAPFNTIPPKPPGDTKGGLLLLTAPVGFEFVTISSRMLSAAGRVLLTSSECAMDLMKSDGSIVFGPSDFICEVQNKQRLLVILTGAKDIRSGDKYTIVVQVNNPAGVSFAGQWGMDSFSTYTAETDTALDESKVMGYPVNNVLNSFYVANTDRILNGNTKINDVDILIQLPDPLKDGDDLLIVGPKGFNLIGNPELANCNEFRWVGTTDPLPSTGPPGCSCDANMLCTARFAILENKDPSYPQNMDLNFKIATINPSKTPFLTDNYWKVHHMRGTEIKSSHVLKSWTINPQLEMVDVNLVGANLAATKESDIEIKFTPVTNAETLRIEAIFPTQFSFDRSTVALPYDINTKASEGSTIIINRGGFKANTPVTLRINAVRLGRAGGQTEFNIMTYADEEMTMKRDEKLAFKKGFRLPGLISVLGTPALKSMYQNSPAQYPVQSLFQPRANNKDDNNNEDAKAEFTVSFSKQVQASEKLIITCQGQGAYPLKKTPFVIIGTGQIETSVELDATGALQATLKPGRPSTEVALQADTPYTIIMLVTPERGVNTWRFDTNDGSAQPTNTNDGAQVGFSPVEMMTLGIEALRSPPRAIVTVTLTINPGVAIVRELIVIAPPGFAFDERAGGCGDMCMPGQALGSTGRRTATIASPTGEPLTGNQLKGLRIRVQTPEQTPSSTTWFVQGQGQGAGTTTGWGRGAGFIVTQMTGTTVTYPAVATVKRAQIAFTFALDVNAGNQISIVAPPGFLLTCSAEGSLKQISLPGGRPDCIDDPLQMRLDTTLTAGQYAFALSADLPPETPSVNTFNIIIRDQDNNVVDAAYSVMGMDIVNIAASDPTLAWSKSDPGQRTQITMGITFSRDTPGVKALLIMLPDKFIHDVQAPTDVQNLNRSDAQIFSRLTEGCLFVLLEQMAVPTSSGLTISSNKISLLKVIFNNKNNSKTRNKQQKEQTDRGEM